MGLYEIISENAIDNCVVCTACFSSDTKGWEICFLCYSLSHSLLCVNIVEQNKTFSPGGGGALGYFSDGYVPPGTPNWHPVLKKISPEIDTPF